MFAMAPDRKCYHLTRKDAFLRKAAGIGGVLNQIERRPAIRKDAAQFTVEIGIPRRQPGDSFGDAGVFRGPVVAPAAQDVDAAVIEAGVHAVAVEFDLVQPIGAVWCGFDERRQLRFDPGGRRCWVTSGGTGPCRR